MRKKELIKIIEDLECKMKDLSNSILALKFAGEFDLGKTEVLKDFGFAPGHPLHSSKFWSLRYINHLGQLKTQGFSTYDTEHKPEIMESDRGKAIIYFKGNWYQLNKATGTTFEIPEPAKYTTLNPIKKSVVDRLKKQKYMEEVRSHDW